MHSYPNERYIPDFWFVQVFKLAAIWSCWTFAKLASPLLTRHFLLQILISYDLAVPWPSLRKAPGTIFLNFIESFSVFSLKFVSLQVPVFDLWRLDMERQLNLPFKIHSLQEEVPSSQVKDYGVFEQTPVQGLALSSAGWPHSSCIVLSLRT